MFNVLFKKKVKKATKANTVKAVKRPNIYTSNHGTTPFPNPYTHL